VRIGQTDALSAVDVGTILSAEGNAMANSLPGGPAAPVWRSRRRLIVTAMASGCMLAAAACGTRLSTSQAQQQVLSVYGRSGQAGAQAGADGAGATSGTGAAGAAPSAASTGVTTTPTQAAAGASLPATGTSGPGVQPVAPGAAQSSAATTPRSGTSKAAVGSRPSPATSPAATVAHGSKATILIGMSCNCSGVIGAAEAPSRDAFQAWVQMINAKGGIDGHPVKLLYADDNNSATQDVQNVQSFVEQDHVIAIVNFFEASGGIVPVAQYTAKHHVAVVGGSGFDPGWTQYPSMFSTATADSPQDYSWAAEMKAAGKTTVGAIYCAEGDICANKEATWKKAAQQIGLKVAYENRESLAAPSFSADCINARGSGVTALVSIEDGASAARIARDCDQQGYRPLIVVPQPFNNPPSYMEGAVAPLGSFPWFLTSGTPALQEYGDAVTKYVHNPTNSYSALGWTNAKLLEKALTGHVSDTPTPQDVFNGLWAMNGETLGGLTPPLSYHANANASPLLCSFRAVVQKGQWVAPVGMQPTDCQP
jgi:branched-chain amino acid transport system substrate-binding protein